MASQVRRKVGIKLLRIIAGCSLIAVHAMGANSNKRKDTEQADFADSVDEETSAFVPLTAHEAQLWRKRNPMDSPWRIVSLQACVGGVLTVLVALLTAQLPVVESVAYGVACVVLPGAVFAYGLRKTAFAARMQLARFFVWELVKLMLTVAMLLLSLKAVNGLNWLALLGGFVVTMKVAWLAAWWPKRKTSL